MPPETSSSSVILIISGPAGSGKTTLCNQLLAEFSGRIRRIVTTTTRNPRPGEIEGVDYHFLSREAFQTGINNGEFIEWAEVHGRFYGSRKTHVLGLIKEGADLLLNIDVQGARAFRGDSSINEVLPGRIHTVFIKPQSLAQLQQRLEKRGSDKAEEIQRRLDTAAREIKVSEDFDQVIVSGSRQDDYRALRALYLNLRN